MKQPVYTLVILSLMLLFSFLSKAQQDNIDSMNAVISGEHSDKIKARTNIRIARAYLWSDTIKAQQYLNKGFKLANQTGDDMAKGMYHLYYAYFLCNKGLYNEGLINFELSGDFFNKFSSAKNIRLTEKTEIEELLFDVELSRGNVNMELFEYEKAIDIFIKLLQIVRNSNTPSKDAITASVYQSIGLAYYHRAQYRPALENYLLAEQFSAIGGSREDIIFNQVYAAMCYNLLEKYDSAYVLLQKARAYVQASSNIGLKVQYYGRLAEMLRFTGKYREATENYDTAIANSRITGNVYMQATFLYAKAKCLLALNQLPAARKAVQEALLLAGTINKKREILEAQKIYSQIEAKAGNYNKAYQYLNQYTLGNDSLKNLEITSKIMELDKKYQAELRETEIKRLEQDKYMQSLEIKKTKAFNTGFLVLILTLAIIVFLIYRNSKTKQKLQRQRISELETEKQLAATESVLKGEEQERTRLAKDLHDGLGGMLSGIKYSFQTMKGNLIMTQDNRQAFERSMDMLDSSIKEMRRVAHNLMPEVLVRYGLQAALMDYIAEINKSGIIKIVSQSIGKENRKLDQTTAFSLYRIVQELINNAIKHSGAAEVLVQTFWEPEKLIINVEDNGKGFDISILNNAEGIGWKNIRSRVDFLKGAIDIHSTPGKGTFVNLEFITS